MFQLREKEPRATANCWRVARDVRRWTRAGGRPVHRQRSARHRPAGRGGRRSSGPGRPAGEGGAAHPGTGCAGRRQHARHGTAAAGGAGRGQLRRRRADVSLGDEGLRGAGGTRLRAAGDGRDDAAGVRHRRRRRQRRSGRRQRRGRGGWRSARRSARPTTRRPWPPNCCGRCRVHVILVGRVCRRRPPRRGRSRVVARLRNVALVAQRCAGLRKVALVAQRCVGCATLRWLRKVALVAQGCVGCATLRWLRNVASVAQRCVCELVATLRWLRKVAPVAQGCAGCRAEGMRATRQPSNKRLPCRNWASRCRRSFHGPLGDRLFKESRNTV